MSPLQHCQIGDDRFDVVGRFEEDKFAGMTELILTLAYLVCHFFVRDGHRRGHQSQRVRITSHQQMWCDLIYR